MAEKITYIGGQAVVEGVMMRGKRVSALSVRRPDGTIETRVSDVKPAGKGFRALPVARGVISFVDSMVLGVKAIYDSADISGAAEAEGETESKFDKWIEAKLGDRLNSVIMGVSLVFALAFSIALFMLAPVGVTRLLRPVIGTASWVLSLSEGLIRIAIFIAYLALMSATKSMKRLFGYHGAEHKTIHCLEAGEELTVENCRRHSRLHKRCGTSFLLIVMIISFVVFLFVRFTNIWARLATRILFVPLIAGISYEVLKFTGRREGVIINILAWPGINLQRLTTSEPDDGELECAIEAMKAVVEREGDI